MQDEKNKQRLRNLFRSARGEDPLSIDALRAHASSRKLYRIAGSEGTVIGVVHDDLAENRAFLGFCRLFRKEGLFVPEVFGQSDDGRAYLIEDLGDLTLYDYLQAERQTQDDFPPQVIALYEQALEQLIRFQLLAGPKLDYSLCLRGADYDRQALLADFDYFRTDFLDRIELPYQRPLLQADFEKFADALCREPSAAFMYRDFQARNIMMKSGSLAFIDFQAGCRGPLQCDVISLLFQSQAKVPTAVREHLLDHYLDKIQQVREVNREIFLEDFSGFVFVRLMQVLGAYGKLGLGHDKAYFRDGIPAAIENLLEYRSQVGFLLAGSELDRVFENLQGYQGREGKWHNR